MGGAQDLLPVSGGGGGGGGGGGSDVMTAILNTLKQILSELMILIEPGQSNATTYYLTTAGTTPSALFGQTKRVKRAIIQNLSTTDNMTIVAAAGSVGANATAKSAQGTVLNKVAAGKLAGDTMTVGNVDLASFNIVTDTNTAQAYSVYTES